MTTQNRFHQIISPLTIKFHEVVESGRFRALYEPLHWYDERRLELAVCRCAERYSRFPKIQEIEDAVKDSSAS